MRILGGRRDAPFIEATLLCQALGLKKSLRFLIDTGASRTNILDSDAEALGIDYEKLEDGAVRTGIQAQ